MATHINTLRSWVNRLTPLPPYASQEQLVQRVLRIRNMPDKQFDLMPEVVQEWADVASHRLRNKKCLPSYPQPKPRRGKPRPPYIWRL